VRVAVELDGSITPIGGEDLTFANGPRVVRVDVSAVRELTLIVEFGAGGDVQDHVNWADARLVK
jgi:hypothetical protein